MKKRVFIAGILILLAFSLQAQVDVDFAAFEIGFQGFADNVAGTLPSNAAVGLNWSHAYIGQFPHFGVGVTAGVSTIPYEATETILGTLGLVPLTDEFDFLETYGIPFPAAAIDARLGGFGFPFDLGFKIGFIPEAARDMLGTISLDYLLIGGDFRVPLLKDKGFVPALSVGAGYTFLRGEVGIPDMMGIGDTDLDLSSTLGGTHILRFTAPNLNFNWQTNTFEARVQVSKNLFIITPHVGLGLAYGISQAGGGLESEVLYSSDGTTFATITEPDIEDLEELFQLLGQTFPSISEEGILVSSAANGLALRAFGGLSLNLFFIKLDVSAMINILSGTYGGAVNLRIQI